MGLCVFDEKLDFTVYTETHILRFWRKNLIFGFGGKIHFMVLAGKLVFTFLAEKFGFTVLAGKLDFTTRFYGFGGKTRFLVLTGKLDFTVLAGKLDFVILAERLDFTVLAGKLGFRFWRENSILRFWRKISIFGFGGKTRFYGVGGKTLFSILAEKLDFVILVGRLGFTVLAEILDFQFWRENSILRFWRKNSVFDFDGKTRFCVFGGKTRVRFRIKALGYCDRDGAYGTCLRSKKAIKEQHKSFVHLVFADLLTGEETASLNCFTIRSLIKKRRAAEREPTWILAELNPQSPPFRQNTKMLSLSYETLASVSLSLSSKAIHRLCRSASLSDDYWSVYDALLSPENPCINRKPEETPPETDLLQRNSTSFPILG
uniref:Uncharacterized protein n=1 Tax=Brassica oleracea var. oleracea TaxID=109376 RepID=A0A0D3A389_BRAOL